MGILKLSNPIISPWDNSKNKVCCFQVVWISVHFSRIISDCEPGISCGDLLVVLLIVLYSESMVIALLYSLSPSSFGSMFSFFIFLMRQINRAIMITTNRIKFTTTEVADRTIEVVDHGLKHSNDPMVFKQTIAQPPYSVWIVQYIYNTQILFIITFFITGLL